MSVAVRTLSTPAERREFLRLPWRLHRGHALWAAPLVRDEERFFDPSRNRAFGYSDVVLALAYRDGRAEGRIMGIVNRRFNERAKERTARFGCIECPDDPELAGALLRHVEAWARGLGMDRVVGPMGFTDQDPEGLMVTGFDRGPTIATYYNFEFLPRLVEGAGYTKEVDYVVYQVPVAARLPAPYEAVLHRLETRGSLRLLEFEHKRDLAPWLRPILDLMSETFVDAYGFVPPDPEEMAEIVRQYRPVIDPRFVKAVTAGDGLVGFIVGMPHIMDGLRKANGRLFPVGFLHVLLAARRARQLDLLIGGVRRDHRGCGVTAMLGAAMLRSAQRAGFQFLDSHHELEGNTLVRAEMERAGGRVYKRYRIYGKRLPDAGDRAAVPRTQVAEAPPTPGTMLTEGEDSPHEPTAS